MKDHPAYKVWLFGKEVKKKSFRCTKRRPKFIVKKSTPSSFNPQPRY